MRYFTLGSLGLRGNYSIWINYENYDENYTKFNDFLCNLDVSQSDLHKSQILEKLNEHNLPKITNVTSTYSCNENVLNAPLDDNIMGLEFTIFEPSPVSITSRKF